MKSVKNSQNVEDMKIENENKNKNDKTCLVWSNEEENRLIDEIHTLDHNEIVCLHQRTVGGIKSRIRHIGCRLLEERMLIEDVSKKLKIPKETLEKCVNIREKNKTNGEILATLQEIRDL